MRIADLAIPTPVAHSGMKVAELFRACIDAGVSGLPYRNIKGEIVAKASIRHVLKETCIPDFMIRHHHLLGNGIEHLQIPELKAQEVLNKGIDEFLFPDLPQVNADAPLAKVLAIMENHDTTYIFVMEGGEYVGVVSIMTLARAILSLGESA